MKKTKINFISILIFIFFILGSFIVFADVENLDYKIRKVEISGEGEDINKATTDASIKALEQVIFTLVQTEEEKNKYSNIRNDFITNVGKYVEKLKIISKSTTNTGRSVKILFQVNVESLRKDLIDKKIISSTQELSEKLDNPKIMVFYDTSRGDKKDSEYSKWSVGRINNYLISQNFKTVDESAIDNLRKDDKLIAQSGGVKDKLDQAIALSTKADLYMSVRIQLSIAGKSGDFTYVQTPVEVKAYESSSGIPFIIKTYQRLDKNGEPEALSIKGNLDVSSKVVIEEAVAGVMPKIEEDLLKHWKSSVAKGRQYVIILDGVTKDKKIKFYETLKSLCTDIIERDNKYIIRFKGSFDDLKDNLEEKVSSIGIVMSQTDLGRAIFKSK